MHAITALLFLACGACLAALVLGGRRDRGRIVPAAELFDALLADRVTRLVILLFWWWIGWHFLVARTVDG